MTAPPLIVLLTDFGTKDGYVASMKAVILTLCPRARLVDLTHEVEPQNVAQAAFLLETTYAYFPPRSIFVSVVDPSVGSKRRILAAKTKKGTFLAPDNGLLTRVLDREKSYELRFATNPRFFLKKISQTFHGRDCFAPTAAHLAQKPTLFSSLGPQIKDFVRLRFAKPRVTKAKIRGEIIYFDHFGNAFTNIHRRDLGVRGRSSRPEVRVKGTALGPLRGFYYEARKGFPVALISSSDLVEIAVNHGSAREKLELQKGDRVEIN
jgi:S-adenosylmethionine hydrolase